MSQRQKIALGSMCGEYYDPHLSKPLCSYFLMFSSVLSSSTLPRCLCGSQLRSASVRKGSFTRRKQVLQAGYQALRRWQPQSPTSCCTAVVQSLSYHSINNNHARFSTGTEPEKLSILAPALSSLSLVALKIVLKKMPRIQQMK